MVKSVDFTDDNSLFRLKAPDEYPVEVFPATDAEFKLMLKTRVFKTLKVDTLLIKTDNTSDDPVLKVIISYSEDLTSISTNQNQISADPMVINITDGSVSFSLEQESKVTAALYSLSGQKVSILAEDRAITNHTFNDPFSTISKGLYLLKCSSVSAEGKTELTKRISVTH